MFCLVLLTFLSCNRKNKAPGNDTINTIYLKRASVILCGPAIDQYGSIDFEISGSEKAKKQFNLGVALRHSFEYVEAEKVFAKIIDEEPECAMAYWGVDMCNYHQVWPSPPTPEDLEKGNKVISIAQSITKKTKREADYINAIALFYNNWKTIDHRTRSVNFANAMENLYPQYPNHKESAIYYALSLDGSADPADKTLSNQRKAVKTMTPNHHDTNCRKQFIRNDKQNAPSFTFNCCIGSRLWANQRR